MHKGVRFISMCDVGKGGAHAGQFCLEMGITLVNYGEEKKEVWG